MTCTTHHYACECREAATREMAEALSRVLAAERAISYRGTKVDGKALYAELGNSLNAGHAALAKYRGES